MESNRPHLELMEPLRIRQRLGLGDPRLHLGDSQLVDPQLSDPRLRPGETSRMPLRARWSASHVVGARPKAAPLTRAVRSLKRILVVDSDPAGLRAVQAALNQVARVDACGEFETARAKLREQPPDLLITNIRLQAFNGLHLIYLAAGTRTRCIAYSAFHDGVLAREVQAAGAFYERLEVLPLALPAYVNAVLPSHDRRDPDVLDRRRIRRGGRRYTDLEE